MKKDLPFTLFVLWRHKGEQSLNFATRKEAEYHRNLFEIEVGHQIVKMEIEGPK